MENSYVMPEDDFPETPTAKAKISDDHDRWLSLAAENKTNFKTIFEFGQSLSEEDAEISVKTFFKRLEQRLISDELWRADRWNRNKRPVSDLWTIAQLVGGKSPRRCFAATHIPTEVWSDRYSREDLPGLARSLWRAICPSGNVSIAPSGKNWCPTAIHKLLQAKSYYPSYFIYAKSTYWAEPLYPALAACANKYDDRNFPHHLAQAMRTYKPNVEIILRDTDRSDTCRRIGELLHHVDDRYVEDQRADRQLRVMMIGAFDQNKRGEYCRLALRIPENPLAENIGIDDFRAFAIKNWRRISKTEPIHVDLLKDPDSFLRFLQSCVWWSEDWNSYFDLNLVVSPAFDDRLIRYPVPGEPFTSRGPTAWLLRRGLSTPETK